VVPLPQETVTRRLALIEELSRFFDETPAETELGTIDWDSGADVGTWNKLEWRLGVTENPASGATEIWELYNVTADAHPIHIHEVVFEVVNRQDIEVFEDQKQVRINPASPPTPPEPGESGFKDTVIAYPGQVTRVRAQFTTAGQFVWHCHIVEHEDNEMMRPYRIGPLQAGQPI
jgi:FtsP/CotA-like multicopper oxidase with cupredoxin domain